MASESERQIRACVVQRLRELAPEARIVHELNVMHGQNRVDVAAIERERILAVEIKSEKDNVARLKDQIRSYTQVFRHVTIASHEKHIDDIKRMNLPITKVQLWGYPGDLSKWTPPLSWEPPRSSALLLALLWRDELAEECVLRGVAVRKRANRNDMITALAWELTGRDVYRSVCRQLRKRVFAEADPPIEEVEG